MNIPNLAGLLEFIPGIDAVLAAPADKTVRITEDFKGRGGSTRTLSVGEFRALLENCTYDQKFGWVFVFPGEEPKGAGCYDGGICHCDHYWNVEIVDTDFQI